MDPFPAIRSLVNELRKLPGIGPKSAQRMAFHLLKRDGAEVEALASALREMKEKVQFCTRCHGIAEGELCAYCADPGRDASLICVVEEPADVFAVEKTGEFRGRYHVLMGALSPLDGIGPEELTIASLERRVEAEEIREAIIATNPNMEGDATAMYLSKRLAPKGVRVSRIARGIPVGASLEFADEVTLSRSLEGRREI
ncbi:MAG: recombination mediator RecR [Nitrospinota bacterium]|nr:recombination mediator RecR [Nitrospinota bacterium]MDP6484027.1 recombination mediator RecR [Nitrospinota bacterium]MDP7385901.1 recombination mediator RecR [Nitrospinota bacterium]HJM42530.1 recombination mediator RecR [Nitrospinota bacterium]